MAETTQHLSREEFDPDWYLATYADVRAAGMDPWKHYATYGHKEGRLGAPVRGLELDHILWRGFAAQALPELHLLLRKGGAREQGVAGWVLARHAASAGRWKVAHAAIRAFLKNTQAYGFVPHPGPWLVGIKACAACGDEAGAREILADADTRFGGSCDFSLARLEIALAAAAPDAELGGILNGVLEGTGLAALGLETGVADRFDRLAVTGHPKDVSKGPLVSVIVPAFKAEATLPTCLKGLRAQSWRNLEIIVVDDASPDATARVAERAAQEDPRIKVIRQAENKGAYVARNAGLAAAQGAFFTVHDADDWSHPQKIEEQVAPLLANSRLAASASHWVRVANDLSMTLWRIEDRWVYRNVSSLMMRAKLRDTLGFWDRVRANADTEYYHRVIAAYGAAAITEVRPGVPLAFGRNAAQSLTLAKATHLASQFRGPRRAYNDAAFFWQAEALAGLSRWASKRRKARALHMPQHPERRMFPAPAELRPSDGAVAPSDYATVASSPRFDPLWYLAKNVDVLASDADPVGHYLKFGGAEDRDAGPGFSASAWRRLRGLEEDAVPLLDRERVADAEAPPPRFEGALDGEGRPTALVFAHAADRQVFGAERSLLMALDRLAAGEEGQALSPVVVLPSAVNGDYLAEVRARAVAVEILPQLWRHRFRDPHPVTLSAIRELIRCYRPREVHVNTLVLDAPLIAAREAGCATVVHVRELPEQDDALCRILGDSARGIRRTLLAQADRFIANSPAVAEWLNAPERTTLRLNTVDLALFDLPVAPGVALRVGMVSSNIAKKGIEDFVAVARLVAEAEAKAGVPKARRCRFVLVGPPSADLEALQPLPSNTTHAGYVEGPEAAIGQLDLVLSLSRFAESFGRTVLEAMAAGRPVICYDRGTPPRLVAHGQAGFVTPADNPEAVARAVLALSEDRSAFLEISHKARERARGLGMGGLAEI